MNLLQSLSGSSSPVVGTCHATDSFVCFGNRKLAHGGAGARGSSIHPKDYYTSRKKVRRNRALKVRRKRSANNHETCYIKKM